MSNPFPQVVIPSDAKIDAGFAVSVASHFPPALQLTAAFKLVEYLMKLPQEKPTSEFLGEIIMTADMALVLAYSTIILAY